MDNGDVFKVLKFYETFMNFPIVTMLQVHINEVGVASLNTGRPGA